MARDPWGYPWSVSLSGGLIGPQGFRADSPEMMPSGLATPVVAVGSNASPQVLIDKLGPVLGDSLPEQIVLQVYAVPGLRVGHSAHVSAGGYVAAAPFLIAPFLANRDHPLSTPATATEAPAYSVGWFNPRHLAALDATEPHYRRILLPAAVAPVPGAQVYVSRHGVIGESGRALTLRGQRDIYGWLRARLPCLQEGSNNHPRPYAGTKLRDQVRRDLDRLGLALPSGLDGGAEVADNNDAATDAPRLEQPQTVRCHPGSDNLPTRAPGFDLRDDAIDQRTLHQDERRRARPGDDCS